MIAEAAENWRSGCISIASSCGWRFTSLPHQPETPAKVIINEALSWRGRSAPTTRSGSSTDIGRGPQDAATRMTITLQELDQVVQRRANLEELKRLGVDPVRDAF